MKVLYFGAICSSATFSLLYSIAKVKPSAAAHTLQTLLLKGLAGIRGVDVTVRSVYPDAVVPNGALCCWGIRRERLLDNLAAIVLPAVNFLLIKQLCIALGASLAFLVWLFQNRGVKAKAVMLYSVYVPVALPILCLSKVFGCHVTAIVTDLSQYLFSYTPSKGLKNYFVPLYVRAATFLESRFDSYVFVSEHMNGVVNTRHRGYIVVEGAVDLPESDRNSSSKLANEKKKAVMYAGGLYKKFGIDTLLREFTSISDPSIELWLFGRGDMEDAIRRQAAVDRRIVWHGPRARGEVLAYEQLATLLVNIRPVDEEFCKYSFPTKTIEYMASETPVLTTRLPGIPSEYDDYLYYVDSAIDGAVAKAIVAHFARPECEVRDFGKKAAKFVTENKNYHIQARRIMQLLRQETS
jgi:glycosyltransferase involved in cell wall biosynthesis